MLIRTCLSGSSSSFEALRAPRRASEREIPASILTGRVLGPRDSPRVPPRSSRRRPSASRSLLDPCRGVRELFTGELRQENSLTFSNLLEILN